MQCEYLANTYINRYKHTAITCKCVCLLCMELTHKNHKFNFPGDL